MFQFRLTFILSALMATLLTSTAMAGSHKPKTTCADCQTRLAKCDDICKVTYSDPTAYAACAQHNCRCEVGKDKVCRERCDIGGPAELCYY